jgi:vancomycin resistance protein VanJ
MSDKGSRGRRFARAFAASYLICLVLIMLVMRFIGERYWLTCVVLYLPRLGFLLPMPFVAFSLLVVGDWARALGAAVLSTAIVVFPLMGLQLFGRESEAERSIRVMSWNTFHGRIDNEGIFRKVQEEQPDVFISQATAHRTKELFRARPGGYVLESDGEFFLASRFPVLKKYVPPPFPDDPDHNPGFVLYTLQTPLGVVDLFNIHPRSPRSGMEELHPWDVKESIKRGEGRAPWSGINKYTALRRRQVEAVVAKMKESTNLVLVAGDSNLPRLSWLYNVAFGDLQDGFSAVGRGLGYTFPAKRPWMRIDRVMADPRLRFLSFRMGHELMSDHHYVIAELASP